MEHIPDLANLLPFSSDDVFVETMLDYDVLLSFIFHLGHHLQ